MTTRQAIVTGTGKATVSRLASRLRKSAKTAAANDPVARGSNWRMATVATVGSDGTITTADGIKARRLGSYLNPAVGDLIIISQSGNRNWLAVGVTATNLDTAWTPYTPTWTCPGGTNPHLGNGTLIGRYIKIGRLVTCQVQLTAGSTTTYGSGGYSFALPFMSANSGCSYLGHAEMLGNSRWMGQVIVSPGVQAAGPSFPPSTSSGTQVLWTSTSMNTTERFGATANNQYRATFSYETDS